MGCIPYSIFHKAPYGVWSMDRKPASSLQLGLSLPSPFGPASRSSPEAEKHFYLQPRHTVSPFPPRQDTLPAFSHTPGPPFTNRPLPSPVSDRRQRFSAKPEILTQHRHPEQQKPPELQHPLSGVYAHSPPPLPQGSNPLHCKSTWTTYKWSISITSTRRRSDYVIIHYTWT
ncbi:uncharacterized protein BKA55DRAFT_691585 [Fusarium redolens]|uniref:Uncharacterized protein n=1 Tax=Fusarium redolens TaxID=48865 RepID=A0A9P9K7Y3_FUSRE|nr:uncharacterized protein BKA55DRAFT_691585 [Fusarium redolens]KAH7247496.1 hypothetical protein BKA55DRAFT_691585 [Fusarium redolens]